MSGSYTTLRIKNKELQGTGLTLWGIQRWGLGRLGGSIIYGVVVIVSNHVQTHCPPALLLTDKKVFHSRLSRMLSFHNQIFHLDGNLFKV